MKKVLIIAICMVLITGVSFSRAYAAEPGTYVAQENMDGSTKYLPELDTGEINEIRYTGNRGSTLRLAPDISCAIVGKLGKDIVLYISKQEKTLQRNQRIIWLEAKISATEAVYYIPFSETKTESSVESGYNIPSNSHTIETSNERTDDRNIPNKERSDCRRELFTITTYCPCSKCNGKWTGQPTACGTTITPGRTIAVDPSVIPLGTTVYIEGVGTRIAEDTGSAIRGNKIDLAVGSHSEFNKWTAYVTW